MENRQHYNRQIVGHIASMVELYPHLRLGQILYILHILDKKDIFNEEPSVTLSRIESKARLTLNQIQEDIEREDSPMV